jgi:hypothetical protein
LSSPFGTTVTTVQAKTNYWDILEISIKHAMEYANEEEMDDAPEVIVIEDSEDEEGEIEEVEIRPLHGGDYSLMR